jgi:peroxiredoxin
MAVISTMLPLGTKAPDFDLPTAAGGRVDLSDFADASVLLVVFLSNHCPYVKHIQTGLGDLARDYAPRGVATVGIASNDIGMYPDDAPDRLAAQARQAGFDFPYAVDETQQVARAYRAACTPDFFVFDADRALVYRGRMDAARPGNDEPVNGNELRAALDAALEGRTLDDQQPSMGCNVKWKPGNEPDYYA